MVVSTISTSKTKARPDHVTGVSEAPPRPTSTLSAGFIDLVRCIPGRHKHVWREPVNQLESWPPAALEKR